MPLPYTQTLYPLAFWIIFATWTTSEWLGPVRWRGIPQPQRQTRDRGSLLFFLVSGSLGAGCYFLFPLWWTWTTIRVFQPALFGLGAVLVLLGAGVRWYAIVTLGRYFTGVVTVQAEQQVIQHGPYRWVRHPSYTGILIIIAGLGLMMTNWASSLILFLSLLIPLLYRISVEEHVLLATFGPAYEAYRQRTKRLIPFVY